MPRVRTAYLCLGLAVAGLSLGPLAVRAQVLTCANVRINPNTGQAYCDTAPTTNSVTTTEPAANQDLPYVDTPLPATLSPGPSQSGSQVTPPTQQFSTAPRLLGAGDYGRVTPGMMMTQVTAVLGLPSQQLSTTALPAGSRKTTYLWQFQNGQITGHFLDDMLISKTLGLTGSLIPSSLDAFPTPTIGTTTSATTPQPAPVSLPPSLYPVAFATDRPNSGDVYDRLIYGLTLQTVQSLLGTPSQELVRTQGGGMGTIVIYRWNTDKGIIVLTFQNDRLVNKSRS